MQRKDVNMANPILHFSVEISTSCPFRSILRGANQKHVSRSCCGQVKSTGSSLPKAERDITLSTFVAQDIRDRTGRSPRTLWAATFPRCDVGRNQSESPHTSLHHDHGLWLTLQGIFCCKCKPVPLVQRVQLPSARIAQYHLFYHGRWKDLRIRLIPRITPNHGTFKELNARFDSNDRTWR
jgi:hypothetical protein